LAGKLCAPAGHVNIAPRNVARTAVICRIE
jgi:hypothetical protein